MPRSLLHRTLLAASLAIATPAAATAASCPRDAPAWSDRCDLVSGSAIPPEGDVVLCATKDARLMEAHPSKNSGIEEASIIKIGNGRDRVIVGFDLADAAITATSLRSARLRMAIWANGEGTNFTADGLDVGTYPVRLPWEEGNGRWDRFFDRPPTHRGAVGRGATWTCAVDQAIENGTSGRRGAECEGGVPWRGGGIDDDRSTAADETVTPSAWCKHPARVRGVPATREACYDAAAWAFACRLGAGEAVLDVLNTVDFAEWDVTADVRDALTRGAAEVSWILRKVPGERTGRDHSRGRVRYFTREGAGYWIDKGVPGAGQLAPRLVLDVD
jgi:hypothetical protein